METSAQEERALSHFLRAPGAAAAFRDFVDDECWADDWNRVLWKFLQRPRWRKVLPTEREFVAALRPHVEEYRKQTNLTKIEVVLEYVHRLYRLDTTEATRTEIGEWIARRHMTDIAGQLGAGIPVTEIMAKTRSVLTKLGPLIGGESGRPVAVSSDEELERFMDGEERAALDALPTGYPRIDAALPYGGVERGETACMMSTIAGGKTAWLVNILIRAVQLGKRCIYYTMEGGVRFIQRRIHYHVTGIRPRAETSRHEIKRCWNEWREKYRVSDDRMLVKSFPLDSVTAEGMMGHLDAEMAIGGPFDLVCVDYAETLKPSQTWEKHYLSVASIYDGLVNVASEANTVLWTAGQANRGGLTASTIGMNESGDSYKKFGPLTLGVSIKQEGDERRAGTGRVAVIKNRNGDMNFEVPVLVDWGLMRIDEDPSRELIYLNTDRRKPKPDRGEDSSAEVEKKMGGNPKFKRRSTGDTYQYEHEISVKGMN